MLIQRLDVESPLNRRCFNFVCQLGVCLMGSRMFGLTYLHIPFTLQWSDTFELIILRGLAWQNGHLLPRPTLGLLNNGRVKFASYSRYIFRREYCVCREAEQETTKIKFTLLSRRRKLFRMLCLITGSKSQAPIVLNRLGKRPTFSLGPSYTCAFCWVQAAQNNLFCCSFPSSIR